eukprot:s717_g2.t1
MLVPARDKRKEIQLPAQGQPVPEDDELERGHDDGSPAKARRGGAEPVVTAAFLQQMMEEQTRTLLRASQAQLDTSLGRLEQGLEAKISGLDDRVDRVIAASESTDERVRVLEQQVAEIKQAGAHRGPIGGKGGMDRRQFTLVYGGWERETRRQRILDDLASALDTLGVKQLIDDPPFTTGARRSIALSSFKPRQGESFSDMRGRMHRILRAFVETTVKLANGRRLWASYSKSPEERAHGAHVSWVKRAVGLIDESKIPTLDVEWSTGSVWCGESLIASSQKPVPPGTDMRGVVVNEDSEFQPWIDCTRAGVELGCSAAQLRDALQSSKR